MPTLTIDSARLNGTPSAGTIRITASRSPLMDSGNNTVYSGTQTFPLDAQGKLSVSLPATDSPSIGPFTYTVEANLASGQWVYRGVKLPANVATIDITDAQSASQQMFPTRQEWDAITAGMNTAIAGKVTGPGLTLRYDTSVGTRVLLDRPGGTTMLYGDTGWRNIADLLQPGWELNPTAGFFGIIRTGSTVRLAGRLRVKTDASFIGRNFASTIELPTGFRPRNIYTPFGPASSAGAVEAATGSSIIIRPQGDEWQAGDTTTFDVSWDTRNAWPTTQPGTP